MNDLNRTTHLADGDLVRHLHAELSVEEAADALAHLDGCATCQDHLESLREESAEISHLLAATDHDGPRPAWVAETRARLAAQPSASIPSWFRLAAAIGFLVVAVGTFSAVPPLRAWMGDRIADARSLFGGAAPEAPASMPASAATAPPAASIEFDPRVPDFVVRFAHRQQRGELTVEFSATDRATVQVVGGETEQVVVLPDGVTIQNASLSTASYRVILPRGIRSIRVIAGEDTTVHAPSADTGPWILPLAEAPRP